MNDTGHPREIPSYYETEARIGGREAYAAAKAAGKTGLDYRQWVQVRTPEFKAWFGDWENGRVNGGLLDKNGEPKVVCRPQAADHITVTRITSHTEQQRHKVRETAIRYVKRDDGGNLTAVRTEPADGFTPERYRRTRTVAVAEEKHKPVTETLYFGRHGSGRYPVFTARTESGKTVGYLSLWRENGGETPFLGKGSVHGQAGGYFVPFKAEIDEAYRRLGVGTALYDFAEQETGEAIYPARAQTDAAAAFWDKRRRQPGFGGVFVNGAGQAKSATANSGLFDPGNPYTDDSPYRPSETFRRPVAFWKERAMTETTNHAAAATPQGGLTMAKHHYQVHMATLNPAEKMRCAMLEQAMEQTIAGLPEQTQAQARTNFYQSAVRDSVERQYAAEPQSDAGLER